MPACVAVHHLHAVPDVARRGCLGLLGSVFLESVEKEEFCQEQVNTSASAEALLSPKKIFFLLSKCYSQERSESFIKVFVFSALP